MAPGHGADRGGRRQAQRAPLRQLAGGEPSWIPSHEGLDDRQDHVVGDATDDHDSALCAGAHERGCTDPSTQGVLGGVQFGNVHALADALADELDTGAL